MGNGAASANASCIWSRAGMLIEDLMASAGGGISGSRGRSEFSTHFVCSSRTDC